MALTYEYEYEYGKVNMADQLVQKLLSSAWFETYTQTLPENFPGKI